MDATLKNQEIPSCDLRYEGTQERRPSYLYFSSETLHCKKDDGISGDAFELGAKNPYLWPAVYRAKVRVFLFEEGVSEPLFDKKFPFRREATGFRFFVR